MGTKRQPLRRRQIGSGAEYQAWSETFTSGYDFFGDLAPFGLVDDRDIQAAAKEAWKRFGTRFLSSCNRRTSAKRLGHCKNSEHRNAFKAETIKSRF
ncbi:hypothetical protein AJ88_26235 [Mesorhizobium amorphae CCBAU 01583]|nr:hypothetical protein AJ88_26235 [Mesorhizobium amorphae CCBAU 01583]